MIRLWLIFTIKIVPISRVNRGITVVSRSKSLTNHPMFNYCHVDLC